MSKLITSGVVLFLAAILCRCPGEEVAIPRCDIEVESFGNQPKSPLVAKLRECTGVSAESCSVLSAVDGLLGTNDIFSGIDRMSLPESDKRVDEPEN